MRTRSAGLADQDVLSMIRLDTAIQVREGLQVLLEVTGCKSYNHPGAGMLSMHDNLVDTGQLKKMT